MLFTLIVIHCNFRCEVNRNRVPFPKIILSHLKNKTNLFERGCICSILTVCSAQNHSHFVVIAARLIILHKFTCCVVCVIKFRFHWRNKRKSRSSSSHDNVVPPNAEIIHEKLFKEDVCAPRATLNTSLANRKTRIASCRKPFEWNKSKWRQCA